MAFAAFQIVSEEAAAIDGWKRVYVCIDDASAFTITVKVRNDATLEDIYAAADAIANPQQRPVFGADGDGMV